MSKFYLAGPLFCTSEINYNLFLQSAFKKAGMELVLPQTNVAIIDDEAMKDPDAARETAMKVAEADLEMLDGCDAVVFNLDGRVPDEGACVELGYAFAKGIPSYGLKTDVRSAEFGNDNMMITKALGGKVARSVADLIAMLKKDGL